MAKKQASTLTKPTVAKAPVMTGSEVNDGSGATAQKAPAAPAKPVSDHQRRINESREALKHPLPAGQRFFEAPDGLIIIGDADRPHVPCRQANGGEININPRREGGR